jgi:hypothetical protein
VQPLPKLPQAMKAALEKDTKEKEAAVYCLLESIPIPP